MADRELDRRVAEDVMGRSNFHQERHGEEYISFGPPPNSTEDCVPCPPYSSDIAADYSVLVEIQTRCYDTRFKFGRALQGIWVNRLDARPKQPDEPRGILDIFLAQMYQPGDYSRAALASLPTKGSTHAKP